MTNLVVLVLLVAVGWMLHSLQPQLANAQAEKQRYSEAAAALEQENDALRADLAQGVTPEKIEEIARDEWDWTRPDEYAFYDKNR